jgi:hypothetical protein
MASVRAENKEKAAQYAGEGELHEVRDDVASAMGVPNTEGCHHGAVTSWMIGPTNLLGDLKRPV